MIRMALTSVVAGLLLGGPALAQSTAELFPDSDSSARNSIKLTTVLMALPAGTPWLSLRGGLICQREDRVRSASGGRDPQDLPPFAAAFKAELEKAGFKIVGSNDDLFERDASAADYHVAAVITDARIVACVNTGHMLEAGNLGDARGDGSMKVDWQVYSPLRKQVVARISTNGAIKLDRTVAGGVAQLITGSFASNVREVASSAEFRAAVSAPKAAVSQGVLLPAQQGKITLAGNLKAPVRPIAEAVGSVVTLATGSGSGSGVLVSDDGYLLTNAHVVGDSKEIRVRWSDRIETVGQVVRVAKDRDIALVKTNARDRIPLAIKRGAVSPGQRVYAIGTPQDKTFQGTVSSGIVSANRIIDGLRYIQSDTSISPGSSGGALLDESGSVIGIAVSVYQNSSGQQVGLNMFIPIGDAMDFLALERQ